IPHFYVPQVRYQVVESHDKTSIGPLRNLDISSDIGSKKNLFFGYLCLKTFDNGLSKNRNLIYIHKKAKNPI
ncbi:MAG: hypothetical protein WCR36_04425, partial [Bacteroidaceae bacterium]